MTSAREGTNRPTKNSGRQIVNSVSRIGDRSAVFRHVVTIIDNPAGTLELLVPKRQD
jgi:hypothetical protein